jgi:hypothetical protein
VVCRCGVEEGEGDEEKREKGCGPVGAKSSFHLTVNVYQTENQTEGQTEGQILRRELLPPFSFTRHGQTRHGLPNYTLTTNSSYIILFVVMNV